MCLLTHLFTRYYVSHLYFPWAYLYASAVTYVFITYTPNLACPLDFSLLILHWAHSVDDAYWVSVARYSYCISPSFFFDADPGTSWRFWRDSILSTDSGAGWAYWRPRQILLHLYCIVFCSRDCSTCCIYLVSVLFFLTCLVVALVPTSPGLGRGSQLYILFSSFLVLVWIYIFWFFIFFFVFLACVLVWLLPLHLCFLRFHPLACRLSLWARVWLAYWWVTVGAIMTQILGRYNKKI